MSRLLASLVLLLAPASALACAVCFDPTEQNREAFIGTTVFLTLLPLALIGGGAWWIVRRYETLEG